MAGKRIWRFVVGRAWTFKGSAENHEHLPPNPIRNKSGFMKATRKNTIRLSAVLMLLSATSHAASPAELQLWSVDALVKVFPGDKPGTATPAVVEVARGEHASFQVVVYSESGIQSLQATMATLKRAAAAEDALAPLSPRFVGYVPVDRPTQTPSKDQLRKPPADYPDPLLESPTLDVPAGRAQAVWVTVPVPINTSPGTYQGILTITGTVGGKRVSVPHELALTVHAAVVGASRLWVTQWFALHWRHMEIAPQPESEDYYALLRRYARNLAEHRHNVALISPLALARYTVGSNGLLAIDFSRFDRWVQIFKEEGVIGRIEGGHIGGRKGGWESEFVVTVHQVKEGKVASSRVGPASPEADAFYARFFPALMTHLREKGWQECYLQHLADEPIAANISSYRAMAALARQYAPGLRIVEACHTKDLVGAIDVWVPQLNYLHQDFAHYQQRQRAGDEVWLYTCVFPQGEYANRFIEQPLLKTRLLHWINFRYGVTGYLHWGYNHWTQDSPFTHTTRAHGGPPYLPAGDPWIVYPGKAGPLDSIRFEAMRDGIADYELLCLLAEKNPDAARRLVGQHVLDFDRYDTDVGKFRAARRELLQLVGQSGCR
jgi:hypothetical protein